VKIKIEVVVIAAKEFIKFNYFFLSKESGQTSRGSIDIPTMLAPRETSILCRQTLKYY